MQLHMALEAESDLQSEKLLAIGRLAAGIAHEINTPTQYVSDNAIFLQGAFAKLLAAIDALRPLAAAEAPSDEARAAARAVIAGAKLDYLNRQVPRAIAQSLEGLDRIKSIVMAMKEFSHPSSGAKTPHDLHAAILSTLTVARSEWKYVADLETELDPEVGLVPCLRDELNQAVLNLVVNAAHAIAERGGGKGGDKGTIRIRTRRGADHVDISISDTGAGIPPEIRGRIFDPFFTTKPVGKGTGQGLAIAWSVVVDKHGGKIWFDSEVGRGTTFHLRLPLDGVGDAAAPAAPGAP